MAKLKAGNLEAHNHYVNNPPGTVVTPEMILTQAEKYSTIDENGHLYNAIIASIRNYVQDKRKGKYEEYQLAFCAHYVTDLSMPLHNTVHHTLNSKKPGFDQSLVPIFFLTTRVRSATVNSSPQ